MEMSGRQEKRQCFGLELDGSGCNFADKTGPCVFWKWRRSEQQSSDDEIDDGARLNWLGKWSLP